MSVDYLTAIQMFIISVLFDKSEYNPKHSNFKPIKVMVVFALITNVWFTVYLLKTIHRIQKSVEVECPSVLIKKEDIQHLLTYENP